MEHTRPAPRAAGPLEPCSGGSGRASLRTLGSPLDIEVVAEQTSMVASVEPKGAAMQTDPSHSSSAQVEAGSVVGLWRYPVKSMMGRS